MTAYDKFSDVDLIHLLFEEEDRLPMSFAKEVISRGKRMVSLLAKILVKRENWRRRGSSWCSTTHAYFLLGAIGGEEAVKPLTDALFEAVETRNDWIGEELPSILGSLGPRAFETLKEIASSDLWSWSIRERAMAGLAAAAIRLPEYAGEIFSFIAEIAADPKDDPEARSWAASVLMDCGRREYEALILSLVSSGISEGNFDAKDVERAWSKSAEIYWYLHDWLEFYSDEQIEARRKRWESEEWEAALTDEDEDLDEQEGETALSHKGIMEALGSDAERARSLRFFLMDIGQEIPQRQYVLAMELYQAVRRWDEKRDTFLQRLKDRFFNSAAPARAKAERIGAFKLFDLATGGGALKRWLRALPSSLADEGMPQEGAALAKAWAEIIEEESLLSSRGMILAKAGNEAEAREQIQENLRRFPNAYWVRMGAADVFRTLKDFAAAQIQYRECLKIDHGDYARQKAREGLIKTLTEAGHDIEAAAETDALEKEYHGLEKEIRVRYEPYERQDPKTGRNDPCPCGSGKKHKKCCLGKEISGGAA
jgi:tetratricopeptide (TPR) repeat protein